jgi:hypothetical protein
MELQNALIIAGVVLLLLLVAYNRWQIYKARRVRPLMPEDDVQPMREPVVGKTTHPETAASSRRPRRPERLAPRADAGGSGQRPAERRGQDVATVAAAAARQPAPRMPTRRWPTRLL